MIITLDGPVASGKSTVARTLAHELNFYYLYSGFLYRGLAYVLAHWYEYDEQKMQTVQEADLHNIFEEHVFVYLYQNGLPQIVFDKHNITSFLKTKDIDNWSSLISAQPVVRHAIFDYQVQLGKGRDVIAEGRDMATVVFPQADFKFYLTATEEIRAQRWQKMQAAMGKDYSIADSIAAVHERDRRDAGRSHSPLVKTADMYVIDGSTMNVDQVVAEIKKYVLKPI